MDIIDIISLENENSPNTYKDYNIEAIKISEDILSNSANINNYVGIEYEGRRFFGTFSASMVGIPKNVSGDFTLEILKASSDKDVQIVNYSDPNGRVIQQRIINYNKQVIEDWSKISGSGGGSGGGEQIKVNGVFMAVATSEEEARAALPSYGTWEMFGTPIPENKDETKA